MASAFGFSSSQASTVDNSITAQDSEIVTGQKAGNNAVAADNGAVVNITDGGAFEVVENLTNKAFSGIEDFITAIMGWTKEQNTFALSGTTALLQNARELNQEAALTSQQNLLDFLFRSVSTIFLLSQIFEMILSAFVYDYYSINNISDLIFDCFTLVFYLIVINNFIKCKDNLFFGFYSILLLIISNYILPLITSIISGALQLLIIIPSITSAIAVVYFIFLCIENKKRTPKSVKWLKIIGIIFALLSIAYGIFLLVDTIQSFMLIVDSGYIDIKNVFSLIVYLIFCLNMIIGQPLIFGFYPFVLYKERYL